MMARGWALMSRRWARGVVHDPHGEVGLRLGEGGPCWPGHRGGWNGGGHGGGGREGGGEGQGDVVAGEGREGVIIMFPIRMKKYILLD